jgi:papain like cysteine protease AvrRpt2
MPLPSFLGPFRNIPAPAPAAPPLGGGGANPLPFTMQTQDFSEWCWAATSSSVCAFYNRPPLMTQCQIASACLNLACCVDPAPPPPWPCNAPYYLDQALTQTGNLAAPATNGALPFASVTTEIDAGRPVGCHISWSGGGGHFNAIYGYDAANQDVDLGDPYYGNQTLPYATLVSSYQNLGAWDYSYLTN